MPDPIPQGARDYFRALERRIMRLERRGTPQTVQSVLGPGLTAQAVRIMDWSSRDATFNGFYYSGVGSINSPDSELTWTGQVIAKDDGTGVQQVWNTDGPTTLSWMRTYMPDSLDPSMILFTEWKKFATASGLIGVDEIDPAFVDSLPPPPLTDGEVPTVVPVVTPIGGIGSMFFRWSESPNADPVTYRLHVRDGATPTLDGTYEVAAGVGLTFGTVRKLKDGTAIVGDGSVVYHAIVTAEDDDNFGPPAVAAVASAEVTGIPAQVTGADIAVNAITSNLLTANNAVIDALEGTTITGVTMTSPVIQTANDPNQGIHLDATGLKAYPPAGGTAFFQVLPAEGVVITTGKGTFDEVTVNKTTTLAGTISVKAGAQIQLAAGTLTPGQPPSVGHAYDSQQFTADGEWSNRYGWATDGTYWYTTVDTGDTMRTEKWNAAGARVAYFSQGSSIDRYEPRGCAYGGGFLWTLAYRTDSDTYRVYKIDPATMTGANTGTITSSAEWFGADATNRTRKPAIGYDANTNEILVAQSAASNSDKVKINRFTMPSATLVAGTTSILNLSLVRDLASVACDNYDFGGSNYYMVVCRNSVEPVRFFTNTVYLAGAQATEETGKAFTHGISASVAGLSWWDAAGVFRSMDTTGTMRTYTGEGKTAAYPPNVGDYTQMKQVSYTLFRTGGNYETSQSPRTFYSMPKRSKLTVTANTLLPPSPGANDPDSVKFYVGYGANDDLGTAGMWKQTDPAVGVLTQNYSSIATSGTAHPPDPVTNPNKFPDSTAAKLVGTSLRADQTPKVSVPGNGAANIDGLIPPGVMLPYAGTAVLPPAGWKYCNGESLLTSLYPDLFAAIGYSHGGSGTTFLLPDTTDKTIMGASATKVQGTSGGADSATLPNHTHVTGQHDHNAGTLSASGNPDDLGGRGTGTTNTPSTIHHHNVTGTTALGGGSTNTSNPNTNPAIATIPKYLAARHIIKL